MTEAERELAAALGRIPSGIFVLTLKRGQVETGMLASWVQQCSFQPPQISVAVQRQRPLIGLLTAGSAFTLNVLDAAQTDMIVHFGRGFSLDQPAFTGLDLLRDQDNGPILSESLAYLTCEVAGRCAAGDHDVFIGTIKAGRVLGEGQPMIHVRKSGMHY